MLTRQYPRGFTLMELATALVILAILASISYPRFKTVVLKSHRSDAHVALMQVAQSQAQWRVNHPYYAELEALALSTLSPQGYYQLEVRDLSATGFELVATARGLQQQDRPCQILRLKQEGAQIRQESGPTLQAQNPRHINRQCWSS